MLMHHAQIQASLSVDAAAKQNSTVKEILANKRIKCIGSSGGYLFMRVSNNGVVSNVTHEKLVG